MCLLFTFVSENNLFKKIRFLAVGPKDYPGYDYPGLTLPNGKFNWVKLPNIQLPCVKSFRIG